MARKLVFSCTEGGNLPEDLTFPSELYCAVIPSHPMALASSADLLLREVYFPRTLSLSE